MSVSSAAILPRQRRTGGVSRRVAPQVTAARKTTRRLMPAVRRSSPPRPGSRAQAELFGVLAQVLERAVHDPAQLLLQLIDRPAALGKHHPTHLDGLADQLVELTGAEQLAHPPGGVGIVRVEGGHRSVPLLRTDCWFAQVLAGAAAAPSRPGHGRRSKRAGSTAAKPS